MPTFFHVDRGRLLTVGQVLEPLIPPRQDPVFEKILAGYPKRALSGFGKRVLFDPPDASLKFDLYLEEVRRRTHPEKPSRFTCLFGTVDLATAKRFLHRCRDSAGQPLVDVPIWEMESNDAFVADMRMLGEATNGLQRIAMTEAYWAGERWTGSESLLEALIELPATVVRRAH